MTNDEKLTAALETAVKEIEGAKDSLVKIRDRVEGGQ